MPKVDFYPLRNEGIVTYEEMGKVKTKVFPSTSPYTRTNDVADFIQSLTKAQAA